ncbi:aminopeptidase [Winogradskya humida]|uniref:Aminopeptidase N n=2 Tax=Winogradskya humida TaxID=113566 RepID=A0ABQ4A0L4_9ACTN|nr:aminopeptidase [Actinoplanes humidus]
MMGGMPSLTRAEATARAATVTVTGYRIDLDLTGTGDTFRSRTVVSFDAEPGASTFLELEPVELLSATLNGAAVDASALADERLTLEGLAAGNELVVEGVMRYSRSGEGLHRFVDPADGRVYLYAQMFLDGARRIFPCFDQPDLKAPFTLTVTAPADWIVAANGELDGEPVDGVWRFRTTKPLSTYFASLIAGPYHACTDEHDGIPLAIYARQALAEQLDEQSAEIFTITKQCLDRYHEIFDVRYAFGHYGQAFVPEFNFGAMENPGIVVFRDEYIFRSAVTDGEREQRAMVIAHEMAHQWFGDLVTMAWWDDLWLNESFAEYLGSRITAEATEFADAWTTFAMQRKAWGIRADQRPSTHPVAPDDVSDTALALLNFDGISYAKGAAVLRQLVAYVGDKAFLAGLNEHFAAHAYANATLADLLEAISRSSGRDLTAWAGLWLRSAQVNTVRAEVERAEDGTYAQVTLVQTAPDDYPTLRPHKLFAGLYDHGADGVVTLRKRVEAELDPERDGGRTVLPELAGEPVADLLLVNDGDLTYAKIRLDEASADAVPRILPLLDDSLARAVLWSSTLDSVTDGERPVAELVTLVLAALPVEREVVVVEDVLRTTRALVDRYPAPETRPAALELLAQACDRLVAAAEPGSSRQLAGVRGLVGATTDTARLRGWLDGEAVPQGVAIDDDLRWLILYRLVVLGAAGADAVEAQYEADRSAFGEQWAARCRAALPDADAKARAWDYLINDPDASNRLLEATAQGFWQPEQLAVVSPYAERYFTDVPQMLARRGGMSGERVAVIAYPSVVVAPETRRLAAELMASPDISSIMHRVVTDGDDDVRRALLARG